MKAAVAIQSLKATWVAFKPFGGPVEDEDGREHCAGVIVHRLTEDDG